MTGKRGLKKLKGPARDAIGRTYLEGNIKAADLARRHNIEPRSVYKFASIVRRGLINHDKAGSPGAFEQDAVDRWVDSITKKRISPTEEEMNTAILQCLDETCQKRGVSYGNRESLLCTKTKRKWEKKKGIETKNVEVGTHARINAVEDIRHMVSFAAMNKYAHDILPVKVINISIEFFYVTSNMLH